MLGGARNGAGLDGHDFLAAVLIGSALPFAMKGRRLKAVAAAELLSRDFPHTPNNNFARVSLRPLICLC